MQTEDTTHSSPTERSLSAQIKLYYDLDVAGTAPAPLLIALHGYGANKRQMLREARAVVPAGFAIASLQGPHQHLRDPKEPGGPLRFGFGWLTNFRPEESVAVHHRALLDLIESLVADGIADQRRIFLLGFSQSCALNYRFAFANPRVLRGVSGICGGMPGDWATSELYKETSAAVFHLSGESDEFYPPSRTADYAAQLRERASDVEFKSYDAGHEIVQAMRDDLRSWLEKRSVA
ncbi:MAG: phospholipase/carboxylesterase [Blastocatellia bacterium]|jgi:phospholipase/carboxylesterase|nr:phospholipase/carboxylesterase [Blastocatellia bacterium]